MASTQLYHDASAGNQKTWTFSAWFKIGNDTATKYLFSQGSAGNNFIGIYISSDVFKVYNEVSSNQTLYFVTNRLFRDKNAWYHAVVRCDTTQAVASNRFKIWINGVQETSFSSASYPAQNSDTNMSANTRQRIGVYHPAGSSPNHYWDGSMSHIHFTDGNAYDASFFGSTDSVTGEWQINASPSVTYGTNGFFILKDGNSGTDQSGQSNTFSISGSLTKTEDNPSNIFCTMNPLQIPIPSETPTFENGNTRVYGNSNDWMRSYGTLGANKGKWWYELYIGTADASGRIGWDSIDRINLGTDSYFSGLTIQQTTGTVRGGVDGTAAYSPNSVQLPADGGGNATFAQGDYLGMGIDLDNNTITIYKNGSALATNWSYNGYNSSCKTNTYSTFVSPSVNWYSASGNQNIYDFNFGNGKFGSSAQLTGTTYTDSNSQGVFKYQPPTNYLAWCTKNLNV